MQFTIYRSTDSGAPTLNGTAGSLIALLDACLVNGYGSKTAAGWTKPYTGTNKAAFRMGAGAQAYLRVDDASTNYATTKGFLTMSDVDTGTVQFPQDAQTTLTFAIKSNTADATARAWTLFADSRTFYLFVVTGNTASGISAPQTSFGFGQFDSLLAADPYNVLIASCYYSAASHTGFNSNPLATAGALAATNFSSTLATALTSNLGVLYAAGTLAGASGSIPLSLAPSSMLAKEAVTTLAVRLQGLIPYPNNTDGGLYLGRQVIGEGAGGAVRGFFRGLHFPLHPFASFSNATTFSGTGSEAGKTFEITGPLHGYGTLLAAASTTFGWLAVETSDTLN